MTISLFTIYRVDTGAIVRTGAIAPVDVASQAREGEAVLVGVRGDGATQKVEVVSGVPSLVAIAP